MYRLVLLSGQWYSTEVPSIDSDILNAELFVSEGRVVLYVGDLEDLPECIEYEVVA